MAIKHVEEKSSQGAGILTQKMGFTTFPAHSPHTDGKKEKKRRSTLKSFIRET